jgi:predicted transcriptional regulator
MINLKQIMQAVNAQNHTPALDPEQIRISGAYVCDMLSDVMGSAQPGQLWITIMKHMNVIAVASMTGVPAILFAKGTAPDPAVTDKALEEGICLISSGLDTFTLAGKVFELLQQQEG